MKKRMKILITTGIYPPKIGGPAQYALNLKESFERMGHFVYIKTFNIENSLPTGIRHIFFFIKKKICLIPVGRLFSILNVFMYTKCPILSKDSLRFRAYWAGPPILGGYMPVVISIFILFFIFILNFFENFFKLFCNQIPIIFFFC